MILEDIKELNKVKRKFIKKYMVNHLHHIIGVGIGYKEIAGQKTKILSIKVYVKNKLPEIEVLSRGLTLLPRVFRYIDIDVVELKNYPKVMSQSNSLKTNKFTNKIRPLEIGYSIGHYQVSSGSIGTFVRDSRRLPCILSNNHVLANSNLADLYDSILQPGTYDGGMIMRNKVAELTEWEKLSLIEYNNFPFQTKSIKNQNLFWNRPKYNKVDGALARLSSRIDFKEPQLEPYFDVNLFDSLEKNGRTTGHTIGIVEDVSTTISVDYGVGMGMFEDQIMVKGLGSPFSDGGDSGSSVILKDTNKIIGLLFAGINKPNGEDITMVNPIENVIKSLNILDFY